MTVLTIYVPTVLEYPGPNDPVYTFAYDIIGPEAFELWAVDVELNRTYIPQTEYTLELNGDVPILDGGTVTITGTIPEGTTLLSLERNTPITQLIDFQQYGRFGANIVEFALDKLTMICQELDANKCDKVDQETGAPETPPVAASL